MRVYCIDDDDADAGVVFALSAKLKQKTLFL